MPGPRAPTPANRERTGFGRVRRAALSRWRAGCAGVLVTLLSLLGMAVSAPPAHAEPRVLVLLLRPVPTSDTLTEAILRIKSELSAGGFDVKVADIDAQEPTPDPRALMERAGETLAPSATIGIFGNVEQGPAELWVVDRIAGETVVRIEVAATSERRISEVMAIRAQELLRASLVELLVQQNRPAPPSTPPPPQVVERRVEDAVESPIAPWSFALELGASAFGGWGGIGPTLASAARLRMALGERWWLRLTAVGLGTQPSVTTDVGTATVNQNLVLLEGTAWLRPRRLVRPVLSLGLGAERVGVQGTDNSRYRGESHARWFAAADFGAGVAFRLLAHWELLLEAHALFTAPRPAVRFLDLEAARAGQPTLFAIITLAGGA